MESEALSFLKTKNCSAVNRKRSITCSAAEQAAGLSLTPVGFLVVGNGTIRMVPVSEENSIYDRIIDAVPTAIDKISEIISSAKGKSNVVVDHEPAEPDSYVPDDESDDYVAGSFEG